MNLRFKFKQATLCRLPGLLSLLCCLIAATSSSVRAQAISSSVHAQQIATASETANQLPDAPGRSGPGTAVVVPTGSSAGLAEVKGTASISGVVVDPSGAGVEKARVTLVHDDGVAVRTIQSGDRGEFTLENLAAGVFRLTVTAKGFASYSSEPITVGGGQAYAQPTITLSIANANTEVNVFGSNSAVADEQIKAEEKQRILGFAPNFYTSFVYDAVPLNAKQKYKLAFRDTFDPTRFVGAAVLAGIEQANKSYKGYGFGAEGYGKRYAAAYGDGLTSDILSHAVFPVIFHQDPRYFYQGTGTFKSRLIHAVSSSVIARNDSGKIMPNYSYLLGDIGSGAISNLYYPHADRGVGLVFTNAAIGTAGRAVGGIVQEFILPRLTTHRADKRQP